MANKKKAKEERGNWRKRREEEEKELHNILSHFPKLLLPVVIENDTLE